MIKKQLLIILILLSSLAGYSQTITPQWKNGVGYILEFHPGKIPSGYDTIAYLSYLRPILKMIAIAKADSVNALLTGTNGVVRLGNEFQIGGDLSSDVTTNLGGFNFINTDPSISGTDFTYGANGLWGRFRSSAFTNDHGFIEIRPTFFESGVVDAAGVTSKIRITPTAIVFTDNISHKMPIAGGNDYTANTDSSFVTVRHVSDLISSDASVLHKTGNLTETANGIKIFAPNIVYTADNQTINANQSNPVITNPGGFLNTTVNGYSTTQYMAANGYRGLDNTYIADASNDVTTIGRAGTVNIVSRYLTTKLFEGGLIPGNTTIRPYTSSYNVNIAPDGGQVKLGGVSGSAIGDIGVSEARGLWLKQTLQAKSNSNNLVALDIDPTFETGDYIASITISNGGSGYTDGVYTSVDLINGTGFYARATLTVTGGAVTSIALTNNGTNYTLSDALSFNNSGNILGPGTGALFTVTSVGQYTGQTNYALRSSGDGEFLVNGKFTLNSAPVDSSDVVRLQDLPIANSILTGDLYDSGAYPISYYFGDSVFGGVGTTVQNIYGVPYLVSAATKTTPINYALGGSSLVFGANSGINTIIAKVPTYNSNTMNFVCWNFGINDKANVSGTYNATTFLNTQLRAIDTCYARGVPYNKIIISTPNYCKYFASDSSMMAVIASIPTYRPGVIIANVFTPTHTAYLLGQSVLSADTIHMSNIGAGIAAPVVIAAFGSGSVTNYTLFNKSLMATGGLNIGGALTGNSNGPYGFLIQANYGSIIGSPLRITLWNDTFINGVFNANTSIFSGVSNFNANALFNNGLSASTITVPSSGSITQTGSGSIFTTPGSITGAAITANGTFTANSLSNFANNVSISRNVAGGNQLSLLNTNTGASSTALFQMQANDKFSSVNLYGTGATTNPLSYVTNVSSNVAYKWTISGGQVFGISSGGVATINNLASGIVKSASGLLSAAVSNTDYLPVSSPVMTTPTLGVATATSINKVTITAPATSATLTIANGKTATVSNTLAFTGTDGTSMAFPSTSATIARSDAANTFTGVQSFLSNPILNTTSAVGQVWTSTNTAGAGNWATPATAPIAGSFSGVGTATTTFTVTIGSTQPNNTYKVNATPTDLLAAAAFYITNKTTTTFDVVYLAGLTGTVTFDWSLFQ